jgi:hypothetical protein
MTTIDRVGDRLVKFSGAVLSFWVSELEGARYQNPHRENDQQ